MQTLITTRSGLSLVLVLICCGVTGCSPEAKRARYLKRADSYFASGDYRKAEVEYRNAARLSKDLDPHIVTRIGTIYYEEGRILEAFPLLTNAVSLNPDDLDLQYKLGTAWLSFRNVKQGRASALTILTKQPTNGDAMLLLADAAVEKEDIKAATQKLNEIVKTSGPSWAAHTALAQLAQRQLQTNEALRQIKLAAQLNEKAPSVNVMLAQIATQQGQMAEAEKYLRIVSDNSPPRSPRRLLLPQLKMSQTNFAEAKSLVEGILKLAPDYVPASALRGQIAIAERDFETCSKLAKTILAWNPLSFDMRLLSARALVLQNQHEQAIEEFERLLANYEQVPELSYEAAVAHVQKGNIAEALAKLGNAIRLDPNYAEAIILRAEVQLRTGAANEAVASLAAFTKTHADNLRAYAVLADAYRVLGKWDEALAIYKAFAESRPASPDYRFAVGSVLLQQRRFDEAKQWFEQALKLSPSYVPAAEQLVDLALSRNDLLGAQRLVDQQSAIMADATPSLMLQAKVAVARKDWSSAETVLNRILTTDTNALGAYSLLALVNLEKGDIKGALAKLVTVTERNPREITSRMLLAALYRDRVQDYAKARQVYEEILKINPTFPTALNDFAFLLSEKLNQLDDALTHATKAIELSPNNPEYKDTLGWIYYLRGDVARALPLIQESAQKLPRNAEVNYHLAMAFYSSADEASARSAFHRVAKLDSALAKTRNVAQRLAVLDANPMSPQALSLLETISKQDPNDFVAAWKLGQCYEYTGAYDRARAAFERATNLNPAAPQPHSALAFLLASKLKDFPKALEAARAARKLSPNDASLAGLLGRLSHRVHDYSAAVTLLQEYVRSNKADQDALYDLGLACYGIGQAEQARTHLATFISKGRGRVNDAKNLILLMDYQNGIGDSKTSEGIAKARLQSDPDDLPALVTLGLIDQQNGKVKTSVETFERTLAFSKLLPLPQRQLAILYGDQLEDDQKALDWGAKARRTFVDDPELAICLGRASFRTGDFNNAIRFLNQGITKRPGDASAFYFLGMSYHKLLKKSEAKAALNKAVASSTLDPKLAASAVNTLKEL